MHEVGKEGRYISGNRRANVDTCENTNSQSRHAAVARWMVYTVTTLVTV